MKKRATTRERYLKTDECRHFCVILYGVNFNNILRAAFLSVHSLLLNFNFTNFIFSKFGVYEEFMPKFRAISKTLGTIKRDKLSVQKLLYFGAKKCL